MLYKMKSTVALTRIMVLGQQSFYLWIRKQQLSHGRKDIQEAIENVFGNRGCYGGYFSI